MELTFNYFDSIDSTNDELKRRLVSGVSEGTVISAGTQTKGRGRSGRAWSSPSGSSVATSIILRPRINDEVISCITLVAALAVCKGIEELYPVQTAIKWPNDVLIDRKKLSGILTERIIREDEDPAIIVGIGINVHQREFPEDIADRATSIDLALERVSDGAVSIRAGRQAVCESVWHSFAGYYDEFCADWDMSALKCEYESRLTHLHETVRVGDSDSVSGECVGIDKKGALLLKMSDGKTESFRAGEVTLRGMDGYV